MLINIHCNKQIKALIKVNLIRCFIFHRRRWWLTKYMFYGFDLAAALWVFDISKKTGDAGRQKMFPALDKSWGKTRPVFFLTSTVSGQTDAVSALYLCSCILRVMTWWTSCNISATVASGASVTQDRGTGFHLPTWIKPAGERRQER